MHGQIGAAIKSQCTASDLILVADPHSRSGTDTARSGIPWIVVCESPGGESRPNHQCKGALRQSHGSDAKEPSNRVTDREFYSHGILYSIHSQR